MLEKPSVLLIPVMSKLHKKKSLEVVRRVRNLFEKKLKVLGPKKPVFSLYDFSRVRVEGFDVGVVFVSSGGTSSIVASVALNKDWFILAYDKNNSLPSALNAKEKMVSMGGWKGKLVYTELQKVPTEIVNAAHVSQILKLLRKVKIGIFCRRDRKLRDSIEFVKKYFQVKVLVFPFKMLFSTVKEVQVKEEDIEKELNKKIGKIEVRKISKKNLIKAFRLYLALKKIIKAKNLKCVTFDCFEYLKRLGGTPCLAFSLLNNEGFHGICENEVLYSPLMFIMANLAKRPVWIANLAKVNLKNNVILLTHCTAATKLSDGKKPILIKPHFESGLGVSLDVPLNRGFVTLAHLRLKPPIMVIAEGRLLKSQVELKAQCRTQAYVRLNGNIQKFVEVTGNHHIVGYGKHASTLALIAERIGLTCHIV